MDSPKGPIYLDTSALIKLYLPEPDSEDLEAILVGRRDLMIAELSITEFASALGRRRRAGHLSSARASRHYRTLRDHALSGDFYLRVASSIETHRLAERLLLSAEAGLRAADALHLSMATANGALSIATFDRHLRRAAPTLGLDLLPT